MKRLLSALVVCAGLAAGCGGGGGGGGGGSDEASGLDGRASVSGLNIPTGTGGGTVLAAVPAFGGTGLLGPTVITHAGDGSGRVFVMQRHGVIVAITNPNTNPQVTEMLNISSRVDIGPGESGMLGLAFDPAFASNGYFYVYYVTINAQGARKSRISRFRVNTLGGNVASPTSERVVLEIDHPNEYHFAGWLGFGRDGMLYITHGDGGNSAAVQNSATLWGKVLRIRVNADGSYAVPSDNPFGATNPVWAMGFRNPFRCSFDRANGDLWCGDVGEANREEINRVVRGGNYGWPYYEGSRPFDNPTNRPYSDFVAPVHEYEHSVGVAVIGGVVYRGSALPDMSGKYLFSDYVAGKLWAITLDANRNFVSKAVVADNLGQVQTLGEDQAGEIYIAGPVGGPARGFTNGSGGSATAAMPATLSATGLFTNTAALTPAPFLIDYSVNSALWSDGAAKRRWFVVPDGQSIGFNANDAWSFPPGTITVKHFELPLASGGTTRLETRVMVHRSDGWTGYTYRWRGDQQDADLLTSGASASYTTVDPATGAATALTWNFPSQTQCMNCHTQAAGSVLGLNTLQFNRSHSYAATGRSANQLSTLGAIGIFSGGVGATSSYGTMPDPRNASASLQERAKAYLDSNCSHCHRPGGPTPVNMDLRYATSLADMNIVGVNAAAGRPRLAAGNHAQSDLWVRASSNGANRMPPLGVQMVDAQALQLLAGWIDAVR
jgi:uncharacterized repeat protein (TIGR03806 family)